MKCRHCGYESTSQFSFCPRCGSPVTCENDELCVEREETVKVDNATNRILEILKDKLFLVLCICFSVATAIGVLNSSLNVINVLITVFLWLVFAEGKNNQVTSKHLRNISGTIYAQYVMTNIACAIIAVCGVICGMLVINIGGSIVDELTLNADIMGAELVDFLMSTTATVVGTVIIIAMLLIAAIFFIFNIFATRNIHKFVKSVYKSVQYGTMTIVKCKTAHNWLMVLGIINILSAVSNMISYDFWGGLSVGGVAAAEIIASVLINRYLSDCE